MKLPDLDPAVDISVSPERMLWIRDHVRDLVVNYVHALFIAARAFRKAGMTDQARRCEIQAKRLTAVVSGLDNPMSMLTFLTEPESFEDSRPEPNPSPRNESLER